MVDQTWDSTVRPERVICWAMAALDRPCAMSSSTARSLSARLWRWLRVWFLDSSSLVIRGSMTVPPLATVRAAWTNSLKVTVDRIAS